MRRYNPKEIEPKWQAIWAESGIYKAAEDKRRPKRYVLEYFPYPSGAAMHVGHVRNYAIGDTISRFRRMQGDNVLHPMGWDAFGLPAENYALKTGISPQQAVAENVARFKKQLTQMGFSYDWSREVNSTDPKFYKWTQWFFLLLYKKGLAYQKEALVNWDPVEKTVLANEQVIDGRGERSGALVEKKALKQWFFKITEYADRLDEGLNDLDWSDALKAMQHNWIGKSRGAEIEFKVQNSPESIKIFTTRPDTIFGATFLVLAPEHKTLNKLSISNDVKSYIQKAERQTEIDRMETDREKTGVFTGHYAINPANNDKIPIWVADYVLPGYGTGAIMAVPAHDERDHEFAQKFKLTIKEVIAPEFGNPLPEPVDVTGPVVIGYDPRTRQFMSLINTKNNMRWFASGGLEKGETYEQAALRELREEAGFHKVEKIIRLGGPTYSYFYNPNKKSNRRSFSYMFLAIIDSSERTEQALEPHEQFRVAWSELDEILADFLKEPDERGHWIEGLERAKIAVEKYETGEEYEGLIFASEGALFNSAKYDGLESYEAREKIVADLAKKGVAKEKTNYKIRDWLISRQRYWGAPIPIIHCDKCGTVAVPEDDLPVLLPELKQFEPSGDGQGPLANVPQFVNVKCPKCGGGAKRETDTMDGFACSSWYFLRFADPRNNKEPFSKEKAEFWLPVDDYIGGAEHAVMHLLYARFWTKVMFDDGLINFDEPFSSLRNHGMILAPDGSKMSKSKNNTIEPDELIEQGYGADSIRLMELFIGPWNQAVSWSVEGLGGTYRFLQRYWTLAEEFLSTKDYDTAKDLEMTAAAHKTIKKVTEDLYDMSFNTAVAAMMSLVNELYHFKAEVGVGPSPGWRFALETLTQLVAPFAPHISEEIWESLGHDSSVHISQWPVWDDNLVTEEVITLAVQINGKVRSEIVVPADINEEDAIKAAQEDAKIAPLLAGKKVKKAIYIPGRLVSLVI